MNSVIKTVLIVSLLHISSTQPLQPNLQSKVYRLHGEGQPEIYIAKCTDGKSACVLQKFNEIYLATYYTPTKDRTYNTAFRVLALVEMEIASKEFDLQKFESPSLPSLFNDFNRSFMQQCGTALPYTR